MGDIRIGAESTLNVLGSWIQVVTGNLTGAQIYGYKGTRLSFADTLVSTIRDGGGSGALGGINAVQVPTGGIIIGSTSTDLRQGTVVSTGDDHHLAIEGNGWFAVANAAGVITYTRNGEFHVDDAGNLVDDAGNFVLGVFDDTKSLVLNDGTSFVEPGSLPVLSADFGNLGQIAAGNSNMAGAIPVAAASYYGKPMTANSIDTVIGTGVSGFAADGTPAVAATIQNPRDVAIDADGNQYVYANGRIRMIPSRDGTYFGIPMIAGCIYTVAGNGTSTYAGDGTLAVSTGGLVTISRFTVDAAGNLYVTAGSQLLMVPRTDGTYYGQAMQANRFYTIASGLVSATGVAVDHQGNVYFATSNMAQPYIHMIPNVDGTYFGQVLTAGIAAVIVGDGTWSYPVANGTPPLGFAVRSVDGVAVDTEGNLYFADFHRIHMIPRQAGTYFGRVMAADLVYTIAGNPTGVPGATNDDLPARDVRMSNVSDISLDAAGNLYLGSVEAESVFMVPRQSGIYYGRPMTADNAYRLAGTGVAASSGDGGPANQASLNEPSGIYANGMGVWTTDQIGHRVRVIAAFDTVGGEGLYTFLDQPSAGAQDRTVATRYVGSGQLAVGVAHTGTDLPLMTLTTVDGTEIPITLTLTDVSNRPDNTAYDNARLIAEAINAKSNETGVAVSIVRDCRDPLGKVALVMGHVQRTLSEAFIDFTDPVDPSADLLRTGAGLTGIVTDAQGNVLHTINVKTLTAAAPNYQPQPGDRITFDATGQMINLSRGAVSGSAPPFATGVHVALAKPANADGFEKTAGSSRFAYTDAAGRLVMGYAGLGTAAQIGHLGIQTTGVSTIGAENRMRPQALEGSNTSITDLLPELLIAQRVFTSTTKLINVGNTLVEDLNGLIR